MQTAIVPVYIAPAAHAFEIAPAAHALPLAGSGISYVAPANERSSGIGIGVDSRA